MAGAFTACARPAVQAHAPVGPAQSGLTLPAVTRACYDRSPDTDTDDDGLTDMCELSLAVAFAPLLEVGPAGCNLDDSVSPPRPGGEYLFAVEAAMDTGAVTIAYLPAYYRDCGWKGVKCWLPFVSCEGHIGDSEAIMLEVRGPSERARWRVEGIFLSAHCFGHSTGDCRWYRDADLERFEWVDGVKLGAPIVWVAEGRQANYPGRNACDGGHSSLDTCDRNARAYRYPIRDALQNIGSAAHPRGDTGGCVTAAEVGSTSRIPVPGRHECFWDPMARFRGWQADSSASGSTPYARYLLEVGRFNDAAHTAQ